MGSGRLAILLIVLLSAASLAVGSTHARSCSEDWPTFRGDNQRTGFCGDIHGPGTGEVIWKWGTPGISSTMQAAVVGDTVYFAEDGSTWAVNASTGALVWRQPDGGWALSIGDSRIYEGDTGELRARHLSNGTVVWTTSVDGAVRFPPAIRGGTVYAASEEGIVYALDKRTGETRWTYHGDSDIDIAPTVTPSGVYVATSNLGSPTVTSLDHDSGKVRWSAETPTPIMGTPAVDNLMVFAPGFIGYLFGLAETDGDMVQEIDLRYGSWQGVSISGDEVFAQAGSNVSRINLTTGTIEWHTETDGAPSEITVSKEMVYTITSGANVYALNRSDGSVQWRTSVGTAALFTTPVVADGRLFVGTDNGWIYALDAGAGVPEGGGFHWEMGWEHPRRVQPTPDLPPGPPVEPRDSPALGGTGMLLLGIVLAGIAAAWKRRS